MARRSTCYTLMALAAFGWLEAGGVSKIDWIYKELRREKDSTGTSIDFTDQMLQVPQYYRFNQHYKLGITFDD